jgi:hypothetical protein
MEAVPIGLILIEREGLVHIANAIAERVFGYEGGALRGKSVEHLVPNRFRARIGLSRWFAAGPRAPGQSKRGELVGLRADGTEFPLEFDLYALDIDGECLVLARVADLTARIESDRENVRRQHELDQSNASLDEILYAASHDLKAPLRGISHLAGWVAEDIEATASPATKENLRLLRGRVARLQSLLDGLLNYSRIGSGPPIPVEEVNIDELVQDIITLLAPPPGFVIVCEGAFTTIRTPRAPILAVLKNLIGNGIMHHDLTEGRIAISMQRRDGFAEFRVSDDGPGIAPQYHEKVFTIFQTLASRDKVEASGIGLAIVKRFVQRHGGSVWIESDPRKRGTTFVFTWQEAAQ